jgi:hypothetical protein
MHEEETVLLWRLYVGLTASYPSLLLLALAVPLHSEESTTYNSCVFLWFCGTDWLVSELSEPADLNFCFQRLFPTYPFAI